VGYYENIMDTISRKIKRKSIPLLVFEEPPKGKIRVGRITYEYPKGKSRITNYPSMNGYKNIIVMTASSPYGELGPYVLKDERGRIMENIWQGQKWFSEIPKVKETVYPFVSTIAWEYHAEKHFEGSEKPSIDSNNQPTQSYWIWRKKLINNLLPVRYPVGKSKEARSKTICHIDENGNRLTLQEARKKIYLHTYVRLAEKEKKFEKLKTILRDGINLMILEVDGPHQESLEYYTKKYKYIGLDDTFIQNNSMELTWQNFWIMVNDPLHSMGHGYCLGAGLMRWA
jgi:hypothetical protein